MSYLSIRQQQRVTVLTADRPPANAISVEFLDELVAALEELASASPDAVVLAGREGFFSAGADLKALPGYGADQHRRMISGINRMAIAAYGMQCPVVAAVTGHAIAGGLVYALCADYRVAAADGSYGLTEVKLGVPYPQAAIGVVRAELPPQAARRMGLRSGLIGADQCVALGVFDEAVDGVEVLDRALEVAGEMAAFPKAVYARTKLELRGSALRRMRSGAENDPLLTITDVEIPGPYES